MNESRAKSSFLPSGLSPSAPDYGSQRAFTGSTSGLTRRVADSPRRALPSGSPPVREFHPPPKVTQAKYHTDIGLTRNLVSTAPAAAFSTLQPFGLPLVSTLRPKGLAFSLLYR